MKRVPRNGNQWDDVYALLDTVIDSRYPHFASTGPTLAKEWGTTFDLVVSMMYWVDVLSSNETPSAYHHNLGKGYYRRTADERLKYLCNELQLDREAAWTC